MAQMSDADRESFLAAYPPYTCRLCGQHFEFADAEYERLHKVCSACCECVANRWWNAHSGEWLTWPNPQRERTAKPKKKVSNAVRFKVYERDGFKCVYCGSRKELTLDHVAAESGGGATSAGNLVTACKPCNSKKGTKSLADFWEART